MVDLEDSRLQPLFDELRHFADVEFVAPRGAFLAVIHGRDTVAGGAFRRYDPTTVEMKRI